MKRRLLILTLLPTLLDPLALVARARAAEEHECRDHVCVCASHCPPRRDPAQPCHQSASEGSRVGATCSHDQASGLASVAPAVLPAEAHLVVTPLVVLGAAAGDEHPTPGFRTIVPPPPKSA